MPFHSRRSDAICGMPPPRFRSCGVSLPRGISFPTCSGVGFSSSRPGGSPKGAERIAACWAEARKVTQISFKPSWTKHANAAPFRLNDDMLSIMPVGVIIFPGSGIIGNLADKARRLGIPVWQAAEDGA